MRRDAVVAMILVLAGTGLARVANAGYTDAQPAPTSESILAGKRAKVLAYYETLVGKTFWIVPGKLSEESTGRLRWIGKIPFFNGKSLATDYFVKNGDPVTGVFSPDGPNSFTISEVELVPSQYDLEFSDKYIIKVKFSDGREGYTEGKAIFGTSSDKTELDTPAPYRIQSYDYVFSRDPARSTKAGTKVGQKAKKQEGVRIGMSSASVLASSWGRPQSVNRTTTASGTREQWVYGIGNYLYFENGVLTAIQN